MSGAWPQTRRAATNKTEARALQAIPPATGTLIGHLTERQDQSQRLGGWTFIRQPEAGAAHDRVGRLPAPDVLAAPKREP